MDFLTLCDSLKFLDTLPSYELMSSMAESEVRIVVMKDSINRFFSSLLLIPDARESDFFYDFIGLRNKSVDYSDNRNDPCSEYENMRLEDHVFVLESTIVDTQRQLATISSAFRSAVSIIEGK